MKSFIVLSQYLFLGFSLIAALKVAKDGNIEISFVFVLLSLNFGLNLINQKQLIIKMAKTTKQQIYFDELNNKIASVIDKISNLSVKFEFFKREFFILKEDLVQLKDSLKKQTALSKNPPNNFQNLLDKQADQLDKLKSYNIKEVNVKTKNLENHPDVNKKMILLTIF